MRTVMMCENNLTYKNVNNFVQHIICPNAIGRVVPSGESDSMLRCDTRCAKFRIAEMDTLNAKLMPKNPPMFCYCGSDMIG